MEWVFMGFVGALFKLNFIKQGLNSNLNEIVSPFLYCREIYH